MLTPRSQLEYLVKLNMMKVMSMVMFCVNLGENLCWGGTTSFVERILILGKGFSLVCSRTKNQRVDVYIESKGESSELHNIENYVEASKHKITFDVYISLFKVIFKFVLSFISFHFRGY
jgi:hypothetical protein